MRILFTMVFAASVLCAAHGQKKLDKKENQILQLVDKHYDESISTLKKVVNINSGTNNIQGVREVGRVFDEEFKKAGLTTQWIDMPEDMKRAGHLIAEHKGTKGKKLLLIGHLDTVFEPDSPFQSWTDQDSIASGPGTNDMKGGDVIILYALKALSEAGALKDAQVTVIMHGDEEAAGHPLEISRKHIIDIAKRSDYALAFETSTGFDYATVARRGSSSWELKVTGKRAHSSGIFNEQIGAGAIYETSRILKSFYDSLQEQYLTFSPGIIAGGSAADISSAGEATASGKTNIVAETAIVKGDLRFISEEQKENARNKMRSIVSHHLPHTDASISFTDGIPSMPPTADNEKLLSYFSAVSKDMGYGGVKAWDPGKRGAGDISYVASLLPCLDGLGAEGNGAHSLTETVNLKSFRDITKRTALFIYRLTQENSPGRSAR